MNRDEIKAFSAHRLEKIEQSNYPVVCFQFFHTGKDKIFNAKSFQMVKGKLKIKYPGNRIDVSSQETSEGIQLTYTIYKDGIIPCWKRILIFENGNLEMAIGGAHWSEYHNDTMLLDQGKIEQDITALITSYFEYCRVSFVLKPPFYFCYFLKTNQAVDLITNVRPYPVFNNSSYKESQWIEVMTQANIDEMLYPLFRSIWQKAIPSSHSPNYDKNGHWISKN